MSHVGASYTAEIKRVLSASSANKRGRKSAGAKRNLFLSAIAFAVGKPTNHMIRLFNTAVVHQNRPYLSIQAGFWPEKEITSEARKDTHVWLSLVLSEKETPLI
ncbi:MAG TPA: hypothetical protein VFV38_46295 [Ktedonobacteraceae bacterium]|nr:hypothetical protein [Ktedonobacteraceae bacterium]